MGGLRKGMMHHASAGRLGDDVAWRQTIFGSTDIDVAILEKNRVLAP
jgi:hypothetical protein